VEFRLLGNLEVAVDGSPVDIGGSQPRTVLAMLLVAGGRVVPAESIIDALWGDEPPASAAGTLQSYVSRLRRALAPAGAKGEGGRVIVWDPPGYRIAVEPDAVDAHRFERLADAGREALHAGDRATARSLLEEGLGLWRGPALLEFSHLDFAWGFAARLEERRLVATEDRIEADLRLGRHDEVIGELGELVAAHPLREQLRHHLALALYRAGRQAEALRVLDDAARTLRDQLGIDPGQPLRDLEVAILNHDPALDLVPEAPARAAAPAPAAAVDGAAAAPAAPTRPALVGREGELRQALAALDEARDGRRIVLVEGEPGIGKTRLVEELAATAAARGAAVHWGRAFEGGATPAFWPWLPPLRALVAEAGGAAVPPELAALVETSGEESAAADALGARFRLFDAVVALLRAASGRRPLVLVLDDLQWADLPSLELLGFVASADALAGAPILLACTVRELEVGRNDTVVETLATLSRAPATRRLTLRGLPPVAVAELVAVAAGRELPAEVTAAIQERAEGNPFFAAELARLAADAGGDVEALGAVSPGGDVPSGVRDVVRRRLARLPEATQRLLAVAAVVGRDVELALLARAAGQDIDAVVDDLDPAVVQRLLVPVPELTGTVRFAHALVREVVVDDVSALRRARTHLRIADAIAATAADDDDAAEILAEHLWAAAPVGVGQRAAEALERAAEVAVRRFAFEAAEGMLERAVQLRRSAAGAAEGVQPELTAACRLLSLQRSLHGYASVGGSPLLRRAIELARRAGDDEVLARLLWTEWAAHDSRCDVERSLALAERLHALGEGSDIPLVRVAGLASLGVARWHRGRIAEAAALLDAAVAAARGAPPPAMSMGLDLEVMLLPVPFSHHLHVLVGDLGPPEGEAAFEALAGAAPDRYAIPIVEMLAAAAALLVGEPAWAERAARRGVEADPESRFTFWGRGLQAFLAAARVELGDVEAGLPRLDEAVDAFVGAGGRTGVPVHLATRAAGLVAAGRLDEAAATVADAHREVEALGERYAVPLVLEAEARLRVARGDPDAAADLLGRAVEEARAQGARAVAARVERVAGGLGVEPRPPGGTAG